MVLKVMSCTVSHGPEGSVMGMVMMMSISIAFTNFLGNLYRDLPGGLLANLLSHLDRDLHRDILAALPWHLVALLHRHVLALLAVAVAVALLLVLVRARLLVIGFAFLLVVGDVGLAVAGVAVALKDGFVDGLVDGVALGMTISMTVTMSMTVTVAMAVSMATITMAASTEADDCEDEDDSRLHSVSVFLLMLDDRLMCNCRCNADFIAKSQSQQCPFGMRAHISSFSHQLHWCKCGLLSH